METAATDEQLVDRLLFRLDDLIHMCKQQIGASDDTNTEESHGHSQENPEEPDCDKLYRDMSKAIQVSNRHYARQMLRPDVPAPRRNLKGSAHLARVDQEPQLTTADYEMMAKAHQRKIELHFDQLAMDAGYIQSSRWSQVRPLVLPPSAEKVLEAFWRRYGKPGKADIYVLCEILDISRDDTAAFFYDKLEVCAPILEAKEMLENKAILQGLQNKGELEEYVRQERENDKNVQVPVEGMD